MSLGVTPPIPQYLKEAKRSKSQYQTPLPPRVLQLTDIQLQERRKRSGRIAIVIFLLMGFLLFYYFLVCLGSGGVRLKDVWPCMTRPPGRFQRVLEVNVYLVTGLNFTRAKMVDIVFNLIAGQGGRALHGWIALHIYSDALTCMMESLPATYELYLAAKLAPVSIASGFTFARALFSMTTTRSRWLLGWFTFATFYVLAFPVLVGAMTGYFSPSKGAIVVPGGSYLELSTPIHVPEAFYPLATVCLSVKNAERINLPPNATIIPPLGERDITTVWGSGIFDPLRTANAPYPSLTNNSSHDSQLWRNLSNYYFEGLVQNLHGYDGVVTDKNVTYVTDKSFTYVIDRNLSYDPVVWINGISFGPDRNELKLIDKECWNGTIFDFGDEDSIACVQQDGYVWGTSTIMTLVFIYLEGIWICGMFGVWWDAKKRGEHNRQGLRRTGPLCCVAELAKSLQEDIGTTTCSYSNAELLKAVEGKKIGYYMEVDSGSPEEKNMVRVGLSSSRWTPTTSRDRRIRLKQGLLYG